MMKSLRLVFLLFLSCSVATLAQTTPPPHEVEFGRIVISNTSGGVTAIFVHLGEISGNQPTLQTTRIYKMYFQVNGKRVPCCDPRNGDVFAPNEFLLEASKLSGYFPAPPFNVVTLQVWLSADGSPINVTRSDGTVVKVHGVQTWSMVPCPGTQYIKVAPNADGSGGQQHLLYLSVLPT